MTGGSAFADDLRQFIEEQVLSVPFLEALLLLRAEQEQPWDGSRLARRLYMNERAAARLLEQLRQGGLLAEAKAENGQPGFMFCPSTPQLRDLVARLAEVYRWRLVEISTLIHAANARRGTPPA